MKSITDTKDSPEELKNTFEQAGERICELKDILIEITESGEQKEKRMKTNEQSLKDPWNTASWVSICI